MSGRNEKCPCGSGKKYKYCCIRGGDEVTLSLEQVDGEVLFRVLDDPMPDDWAVPRWQAEFHAYDGGVGR